MMIFLILLITRHSSLILLSEMISSSSNLLCLKRWLMGYEIIICVKMLSLVHGAWGRLSQKSSQTSLPCLLGAVRERRNERSNLQMEWKANQYSWCERLWNILWHSAWSLTYVSYSSNCQNVYWAFTLIEKMFQEECTFKFQTWDRSQETHKVRKLV